jgi:hypothetical protein
MISACRAKVNGMTDAREKGIQVFRELLRGARR